jgi:hypothetical protein
LLSKQRIYLARPASLHEHEPTTFVLNNREH